jgi:flagellar hook-associated protein 3 FlgL
MINTTGNRMTMEITRQSRLAQNIARTQIAISTGKRIPTASADPIAAARVSQIERAQSNDATWSTNISLAGSLAGQADSVIASLSERMVHARGLMLAGANGTATSADRATYAAELRGIAAHVADLRATQNSLGQPLFATEAAMSLRLDANLVMAPVATAANVFDSSGTALTQLLIDAAVALETNNTTGIATALNQLGSAVDSVSNAAADQGVRAARIDTLAERNAARGIDMAIERSGLEDTDIASAIATLNGQTLTLEAAQAAFARINRRTLFDILG